MKKILFLNLLASIIFISNISFAQSNDEKAIIFLDSHLKMMFKVLKTKPDTISATCMDSLKKLHNFKEKNSKGIESQNTKGEINIAIIRSLYTNSIQFCETDVQAICNHRVDRSIRNVCKELLQSEN